MKTPPLSDFSSGQVNELKKFYNKVEKNETKMKNRLRALRLCVVLTKEKPALSFSLLDESYTEKNFDSYSFSNEIENLVAKLEISYRKKQNTNESTGLDGGTTDYIFKTDNNNLPPDFEYNVSPSKYHRQWGEFFGYPQSAIEAFVNEKALYHLRSQKQFENLVHLARESDIEVERLERLALNSFRTKASLDGVKDAISTATRYHNSINRTAETYDIESLIKIQNSIYTGYQNRIRGYLNKEK